MECFCNDRENYAALVSESTVIEPLTPEDSEKLWALLDYSTIISMVPLSQGASYDDTFSFHTTGSMPDVFRGEGSSTFAFPEPDSAAQLGVANRTRSPSIWGGTMVDIN